ncbi:hypothetical protein [Thermoactinomyces sp. CICC 10522]|uniref:hypothetical protein n=1 Tax=Thermoactinomyces sp. CICC 10522 TaxID=2767427 RepID=UPI0018DB0D1C|nr:hypothetical protein [Thermoactinomyces sp. CICC 10522]MBH8605648.1 hypothetical protein [Thermoactinomyces sp. CICC 10522]
MATFYEALIHKNRLAPMIMKRPEVIGIGIGYANPKVPSQGACLNLYTCKNLSASIHSSLQSAIMKAIRKNSAVPVRIIQRGRCTTHHPRFRKSSALPSWQSRLRPVPGGASIGNADGTGTAGVIVSAFSKYPQLYILSNNHVLTHYNTNQFSETIQPGPSDGGKLRRDRIGRAFLYVPFNRNGVNYIDAALSIPDRNDLLDPRYLSGESGQRMALPGHLISYKVGERFKKTGRTSGMVRGIVESIHTDIKVLYYLPEETTFYYRNQTIVTGSKPSALPGDSGSVWLRDRDNFAAAVLLAGTDDGIMSVNYPIHWAVQALKIRIARPSGLGKATSPPPNHNFAYVQPLNPVELEQIRVLKVKDRGIPSSLPIRRA